ncbi:hypothetical protein C6Y14_28835 [Streptomyces dioscori]|uniref:Uncharacterized protein n=1 Tax=Streptomyces dioscori TaxID=2109333 RepID=A0A2P8Q0Y3_9ACTN|nr:hypothetical protein [Streptomyces dioscori]PSM39893.1 hypothetical protein C6Y14_28835 [Streptomyces dioscori]
MSPPTPTAATVRTEDAVPALLASLQATLQGPADQAGCPLPPSIASAFADDSTVRPLAVAGGVWAVLRESPDRSCQVLCLHNPSSDAVSASLDALLPETAGQQAHFVRGALHTTQETDGLRVHLAAFGHAWITFTR